MASGVSVTQVRVACECPRLFYLAARFGGCTLFAADPAMAGLGVAFHQLSEACALQLPHLELSLEPSESVAQSLQQQLYRTVFYPYLQSASALPSAQLSLLWQALTRLIQRWAELLVSNRRFCPEPELIAKTFLAQEITVQHNFELLDGGRQAVQGRLDSLLYDFALHRVCVVEYKTYVPPDPASHLAQVALYSVMLRHRLGVPIDSAVYTVLPDWQGQVYAWEQLVESVERLIPAKLLQMQIWQQWQPGQADPPPPTVYEPLCAGCPQRRRCAQVFDWMPPSGAPISAAPSPVVAPESFTEKEAPAIAPPAALAAQLVATLSAFGRETTCAGIAVGPAFVRVKLKPQPGVTVSSMLRLADDLRVQMGLRYPPLIAPQAGYVSVDLPRPDRQPARFEQYLSGQARDARPWLALGIDLNNRLVEADLSDPNTCHFLVGGTTGSGKSEWLRSQLLSLLIRHDPSQLKLVLVDPKRVTFPEFEQSPYLYDGIVKDSDGAITLMTRLVAEMETRYQRFEQQRCLDLQQYNQTVPETLPRIICIFDEYADFMADKATRQALENGIKRLGAMARAAGIHLVIATQRPDASVVTPLIRANLPGRVALRTASEADSAIILGGKQTTAVNLLGQGDLLCRLGGQVQRLQGLFASPQTISQCLQPGSMPDSPADSYYVF
jgi:S-DNA-T family DNA segregation ATPase FtsK/SpoIIIE